MSGDTNASYSRKSKLEPATKLPKVEVLLERSWFQSRSAELEPPEHILFLPSLPSRLPAVSHSLPR
jgi:hypothetical protein